MNIKCNWANQNIIIPLVISRSLNYDEAAKHYLWIISENLLNICLWLDTWYDKTNTDVYAYYILSFFFVSVVFYSAVNLCWYLFTDVFAVRDSMIKVKRV